MATLFSDIPECENANLVKLYNLTSSRMSGVQPAWLIEVASVARTAEFFNEQLTRLLIHAICYLKAPRGSVEALRTRAVTLEALEEAFGFVLHCIHFESLGPARKIRPRLYNLPELLTACSTRTIEMGALLCLEGLVARMWPRPDVTLEISPSPCSQCNFMPSCGVSDGSCENCGARKRQSGENRQYNERVCSRLQLRVHGEKRGDTDLIVEVSGEVGLHEARRGFKLGRSTGMTSPWDCLVSLDSPTFSLTAPLEPVPLGELAGKQGPRTVFRLFLKLLTLLSERGTQLLVSAAYVWPFEPVPLLHYGVKCFCPSLRDVFLKKVLAATSATVGPTRAVTSIKRKFRGGVLDVLAKSIFPSLHSAHIHKIIKAIILAIMSSSNNPGMREHIRILLLQEPDNTSIWTEIVEGVTAILPTASPIQSCSSLRLLPSFSNDDRWIDAGELALRNETGICLLESIEKLARAQLSGIVRDNTQTCTKGGQAVADQFLGVKVEAEVTCSVIATASVKYGRYDGSRTLAENMGLSAAYRMSMVAQKVAAAFDLVFSPPSLATCSTAETSRIDRRVAIDYIQYVRSSNGPIELSKEGERYLNEMLGRLDEASQNNHMAEVTPPLTSALRRSALVRLCRACCRVELSEMIEVEHVKEALDIYMGNAMIRQDALTGRNPSEDGVELESADAGCDGDVECEGLISEANYNGLLLKKAGNVYEYCR
ncbi:minichromosome maintenance protein 5 [Perkinsus olseni]|uniref:Minichromosome maintenance protein 5 n=1 Tax=Perkinsus olseni TaxID=32597 RepID=A0A7J6LJP3_PEROL|nr:minichromosome maintenance protein 5 [Perkinsus olseni]